MSLGFLPALEGTLMQPVRVPEVIAPARTPASFTNLRRVIICAEAILRSGESRSNPGIVACEKSPRDVDENYARWHVLEAKRREIEQLFKAKRDVIRIGVSS